MSTFDQMNEKIKVTALAAALQSAIPLALLGGIDSGAVSAGRKARLVSTVINAGGIYFGYHQEVMPARSFQQALEPSQKFNPSEGN